MKESSQDKKNNILKATLELIAEHGFHGTSISLIAEKADVNVGSIYYYFTNKDDIVIALYVDCKTQLTQCAFKDYKDSNPADKNLKLMIGNAIRYLIENKSVLSFLEQFENSPYVANISSNEELIATIKPYIDIYEQSNMQALIKELPMEIFQGLLGGAVTALTKYYLNTKDADMSVMELSINAIWDMVKK